MARKTIQAMGSMRTPLRSTEIARRAARLAKVRTWPALRTITGMTKQPTVKAMA